LTTVFARQLIAMASLTRWHVGILVLVCLNTKIFSDLSDVSEVTTQYYY